jgi:hypothetical protein
MITTVNSGAWPAFFAVMTLIMVGQIAVHRTLDFLTSMY